MGGRPVTGEWIRSANRLSDWSRAQVVVAGLGVSGFAAADGLMSLGAKVTVLDESESHADKATLLETLDVTVRLGRGATAELPPGTDLVVTSPGWRPSAPLLKQAAAAGVPVWGETELAWRMMQPDRSIPWLAVTGTNGKTTTTQMLESMLIADGRKAAAVGNIGRPIIEAILDDVDYDVFAVELSSFQLHWMNNVNLHSAVVLNVHADHLEWYAGDDGMQRYTDDKAKIYQGVTHSCVYNVDEPVTERMVEDAEVVEGARAIGFTLGTPAISMLGIVDDLIVDRAFVEQRRDSALELAKISDVQPFAPHNVANALAAAALARSYGVRAPSVAAGLQRLQLAGHRIQKVAESGGVAWVDDSKATNPHAANSAMQAFDSFVWIAGGQAKGTTFDELISSHRSKMRGAVVIGVDRHLIAETLARHAPDLPVRVLDSTDTGVMDEVVALAGAMARPGDTVLLSPGCASLDMFDSYSDRGDAFAQAVARYLN
ncbi:UDP-N-acetylmuramoyl-L-alanine--D-glutamate ligase [Tessaracoccus flavus]|uniref:UDP-N-acetylmuramoylalanine--D-glutamate ligase n=1 Tax=Tessaracoccus flavus TaxID=1610493 RepID=A0A1Q2CD80_9ACTN|nr:UDP-N-acetylmuramoyl-L-alanine--D-glutamate ligase [Tessaracoccus flavus]AQP44082.1 UDP-N-acetylmuramoyl-L-alanine--D-glutamate ligase [Tessaracoccus flavus]SDY34285.1 UDP-N-acetylmuramoylalanine--D-glutamate ligase [Tessaracoccus flavus]